MYEKITDENPYKAPMRIYPAIHYTMGGLWVDYNLMSTIPGLFVLGEANFSDHGANRLGASALMQGLADGYFVAPSTLRQLPGAHAAAEGHDRRTTRSGRRDATSTAAHRPAAGGARARRRRARSTASSASCCGTTSGMGRNEAGLKRGARARSRSCARSSGRTSSVPGTGAT